MPWRRRQGFEPKVRPELKCEECGGGPVLRRIGGRGFCKQHVGKAFELRAGAVEWARRNVDPKREQFFRPLRAEKRARERGKLRGRPVC